MRLWLIAAVSVTAATLTPSASAASSFEMPNVRPGIDQAMVPYRNRPEWSAAPVSTLLRIRSPRRLSFGVLSIVVPPDWHWRMLRSPDPGTPIVQLSNRSLRVRHGIDPIKNMARRTFVLTLIPLGRFGSVRAPTIERRDFLARADPSRPRGHAVARRWSCSRAGRCFSITFEYGSERVPQKVLAVVNSALRTLRASPVRP